MPQKGFKTGVYIFQTPDQPLYTPPSPLWWGYGISLNSIDLSMSLAMTVLLLFFLSSFLTVVAVVLWLCCPVLTCPVCLSISLCMLSYSVLVIPYHFTSIALVSTLCEWYVGVLCYSYTYYFHLL
jgi:hypothetical protein